MVTGITNIIFTFCTSIYIRRQINFSYDILIYSFLDYFQFFNRSIYYAIFLFPVCITFYFSCNMVNLRFWKRIIKVIKVL